MVGLATTRSLSVFPCPHPTPTPFSLINHSCTSFVDNHAQYINPSLTPLCCQNILGHPGKTSQRPLPVWAPIADPVCSWSVLRGVLTCLRLHTLALLGGLASSLLLSPFLTLTHSTLQVFTLTVQSHFHSFTSKFLTLTHLLILMYTYSVCASIYVSVEVNQSCVWISMWVCKLTNVM